MAFTALLGSGGLETDGAAKLALSPGIAVCWVRAMSFNRDKALEGKGGWHLKQMKWPICSRPFVTWFCGDFTWKCYGDGMYHGT